VYVRDLAVFDYLGHDVADETKRSDEVVEAALGEVHSRYPEVPAEARTPRGRPTEELLRACESADLLVVGSRGLGGFRGLLLGSVSDQVAHHASCPVLIARSTGRPVRKDLHGGVIVVGVDGSAESGQALRFALEEAGLRQATLRVVCAWEPVDTAFLGSGLATLPGEVESGREGEATRVRRIWARTTIERMFEEQVSEGCNVHVQQRAVDGEPISVLVDESERTDLLIVGSRGHGSFAGTLLGSVSRACAHHARCPVAIVRRTA
jgi:nucleotide-binding universal stress UspA family protein